MRILTSATVCKSQTLKRTTVHGEGPHQFAGGPAWPAFTSATVTTTAAMAVRLDEGKAGSHLTSDDDEDYLPVGSLRLSAPLIIFTLIVSIGGWATIAMPPQKITKVTTGDGRRRA